MLTPLNGDGDALLMCVIYVADSDECCYARGAASIRLPARADEVLRRAVAKRAEALP